MFYQQYLKSEHWQAKRREAREFYGNTCCLCGSKDKLNVHHRNYDNLHNENIAHDLILLCEVCHSNFHGKYPEPTNPIFDDILSGIFAEFEPDTITYTENVFMFLTGGANG